MGVIHKLCIAIFLKQYSSLLKILQVILHINTALDTALTGISEDENIIIFRENHVQKEHASFLHVAINEMIKNIGVSFSEINAVSLVNGPGSYTGLRVGLAAAKGICYAMDTPLITFSTLKWLAKPFQGAAVDFICPLIDARRMEVFTAMYTTDMKEVVAPYAKVLDNNSFEETLSYKKILFTGNAVVKLPEHIKNNPNAVFSMQQAGLKEQVQLAVVDLNQSTFTDILFAEPLYAKAFYSITPSK